MMNTWEAIFSQSPVNKGFYNGEKLPQVPWDWPKRTWFQARLNHVRESDGPYHQRGKRRTPRPSRNAHDVKQLGANNGSSKSLALNSLTRAKFRLRRAAMGVSDSIPRWLLRN